MLKIWRTQFQQQGELREILISNDDTLKDAISILVSLGVEFSVYPTQICENLLEVNAKYSENEQ